MRSVAIALGMAVLPVAGIYVLLGRAQQSWHDCFFEVPSQAEPLGLVQAIQSQAALLTHPLGWVSALPFVILALVWWRRPNRHRSCLIWFLLI